jgi:hypothetical protein
LSPETIRRIRKEGNLLHRSVQRELYINTAGLKHRTEFEKIFRSYDEFGDPGLFLSAKDDSEAESEDINVILIRRFLAEYYLASLTAGSSDKILTFEAETKFTANGQETALRSGESKLISERSKRKRDEIANGMNLALEKITPVIRRSLGVITEGAERLGFGNYLELTDDTDHTDTRKLVHEAGILLADTDYVSRDMLGWFFNKKMELELEDASVHDMEYLLNSAELKGLFPKSDLAAFSARALEESGLNPGNNITLDLGKRKAKAAGAFCFTPNPPGEIVITMYPVGGVRDYELFFSSLGHALTFAFTDADDDFEIRAVRSKAQVGAYSELFRSLIYGPKWLKKYLRIDADADFLKFLYLRRLMSTRITAARVLYEAELYKNPDSGELPAIFKERMEKASHCRTDEREYLWKNNSRPASFTVFNGMLIEPSISRSMKEKFDEEWWRIPAAGDFLKGLWREGGKLTEKALYQRAGFEESAAGVLIRSFEKGLG